MRFLVYFLQASKMRWCIKMTNIRLGERNNFLRECVCSLKVYAAARPFHSVPCFSRRQPSFYGLFVFIPNLPITVSPLSNFADKNAASAGMSQYLHVEFFAKSEVILKAIFQKLPQQKIYDTWPQDLTPRLRCLERNVQEI